MSFATSYMTAMAYMCNCNEHSNEFPPFLYKSFLELLTIVVSSYTPKQRHLLFGKFALHLMDFAQKLESTNDWKPSCESVAFEKQLNRRANLKEVYTNMIDLIFAGADSQEYIYTLLAKSSDMFRALEIFVSSNIAKKVPAPSK